MFGILGKKKLTDNQVANIFVNTTLEAVEKGWPLVAEFIQDSPEFVRTPEMDTEDYGKFLMIVVAANFSFIPDHFEDGHDKEVLRLCVRKFASVFELEPEQFARKVKEYREFLSRVNMPSKNMLYAMSKGIFHKYDLNDFQEPYFRNLKTPNPIFLKNLDEVMRNYLWDWKAFHEKYKLKEDTAH
ncbi:MAG: hypothetical protein KDC12_10830 [Flavobacteriales bacterium]|nr:hypothetical protein [Flavobacteriales bacterium]